MSEDAERQQAIAQSLRADQGKEKDAPTEPSIIITQTKPADRPGYEPGGTENSESEAVDAQQRTIAEVFWRHPDLAGIGSQEQYAEYLKSIAEGVTGDQIMWHGGNIQDETQIKTEKGIYFTESSDYATEFVALNENAVNVYPALLKMHNPIEINYINYQIVEILMKIMQGHPVDPSPYDPIPKVLAEKLLASPELMEQIRMTDGIVGKDLYDNSNKLNTYSYADDPKLFYKLKELAENTLNYVVFKGEQIHLLGAERDKQGFKQFVTNLSEENKSLAAQHEKPKADADRPVLKIEIPIPEQEEAPTFGPRPPLTLEEHMNHLQEQYGKKYLEEIAKERERLMQPGAWQEQCKSFGLYFDPVTQAGYESEEVYREYIKSSQLKDTASNEK